MEKNWKVEANIDLSTSPPEVIPDSQPNDQAAPNPEVRLEVKSPIRIKIVDTTMSKDFLKDVMKITNESKKISKDKAEMAEIIKKEL